MKRWIVTMTQKEYLLRSNKLRQEFLAGFITLAEWKAQFTALVNEASMEVDIEDYALDGVWDYEPETENKLRAWTSIFR